MDIVEKLLKNNPCGQTLGHGDSCQPGWECQSCNDRQQAASEITSLRQQLAEQTSSEPYAMEMVREHPYTNISYTKGLFYYDAKMIEALSPKEGDSEYASKCTFKPLFSTPPSVEVLVEALRLSRHVLNGEGIYGGVIKKIDEALATYSKPITAEVK